MPKKIAVDWDDIEIRLVVAQCSGRSITVTDAAVIPIGEAGVTETLRGAIARRGLEKSDALIAIGRGKAELRQLQLPQVPAAELPDMVRFQAVRNFASAGDSAIVDFLPGAKNELGISVIAAAVTPGKLDDIKSICSAAGIAPRRIALRPLAAAGLYLQNRVGSEKDNCVLVDLLASDAEIVVVRQGVVDFVRTVRLPEASRARSLALTRELKRSLVASGAESATTRLVLWGRESVHRRDVEQLTESTGMDVTTIDPLEEVSVSLGDGTPDHVGRLAPLIGLLTADTLSPERLIDFMTPRRRPEPKTNRLRTALLSGIPVVLVGLVAWTVYSQFATLNRQIDLQTKANAERRPEAKAADALVEKTGRFDRFLNADVNWLTELKRLAESIPPAEKVKIRSINATANPRLGGGVITVAGGATDSEVINDLEAGLRDETHSVTGDGFSEDTKTKDAYRWQFNESIFLTGDAVQSSRYELMEPLYYAESTPESGSVKKDKPTDAPELNKKAGPGNQPTPEDSAEDAI